MLTDGVAILQEIIDQYGSCEWAVPAICKRCPLGNKRVDGRRVSCADYLKIDPSTQTDEEIEEIYAKAAEDEIFNIEFEKALE